VMSRRGAVQELATSQEQEFEESEQQQVTAESNYIP